MSYQLGCQVGQRNAAVGIGHTTEMPGSIISNRSEEKTTCALLAQTSPPGPWWGL